MPLGSDLLFRLRLGVPWAMLSLVASCLVVSAPMFFDPPRYYPLIGVGYCEQDSPMGAGVRCREFVGVSELTGDTISSHGERGEGLLQLLWLCRS